MPKQDAAERASFKEDLVKLNDRLDQMEEMLLDNQGRVLGDEIDRQGNKDENQNAENQNANGNGDGNDGAEGNPDN